MFYIYVFLHYIHIFCLYLFIRDLLQNIFFKIIFSKKYSWSKRPKRRCHGTNVKGRFFASVFVCVKCVYCGWFTWQYYMQSLGLSCGMSWSVNLLSRFCRFFRWEIAIVRRQFFRRGPTAFLYVWQICCQVIPLGWNEIW